MEFRIYRVESGSRREIAVATGTEKDAIKYARQLGGAHDLEVWQGDRFVSLVRPGQPSLWRR